MKWGMYSELSPEELSDIRTATPVAYIPWGSLEWHGPHLPLGTDGIVAQALAQKIVEQTGGVVLPVTWWSSLTLPHIESISPRSSVVRSLLDDLFTKLLESDWKVVVVISGHYAPGFELMLIEAAEEAINQHGLLVMALHPFILIDQSMLDHAALWETSIVMALRPELVNLKALGNKPLTPSNSAVIGSDPRGTATSSMGRQAIAVAVDRMAKAVDELLTRGSSKPLYVLYEERRQYLRPYLERYSRGSLEEANRLWWKELCRED